MLSQDKLGEFEEKGFLVIEDLIDRTTVLEPLIAEYEELLSDLRRTWIAEGRLDPAAPSSTFQELIISAYKAGLDYFQPMDISLPPGEIVPDLPFHA